jgi:hypothetical protein
MSAFEEQELKKVADALAALTPRPAHLDRDGILFEAGRRSARTAGFWPWTTVGMTAVALGLAVALAIRPHPPTVVHFVPAPQKPDAAPTADVVPEPPAIAFELRDAALPSGSYFREQQTALRHGLESLQGAPVEPPARPSSGDPIPSVGKRDVLTTILLTGEN